MKSFMAFMEKYLMPIAAKIGAQRHLVAIRDAFVAMIPITMIGALATLINNLPAKAYQNFMQNIFGDGWRTWGGDVWWGSIAIMAVFLVAGIAYFLAKSYGENAIQSAMVALSGFFILIPQIANIVTESGEKVSGWGFVPIGYLGTAALFTAIIVAIISTEIYVKLSRVKKLVIKLPDGVPPEVSRSFAKLIPGMISILVIAFLGIFIKMFSNGQALNDLINTYLAVPIKGVADSMGGAIAIAFFVHFLWIFGLHGANIALPVTETLLMDLGGKNAALAQAGATTGYHVMAGPFFDAFIYLGGAGMILGLVIAILIASKRRKDMVALGIAPAIFNISEPVIFGLPIVLNPVFMIPFVLGPIITTIISYSALNLGLVAPIIVAKIPWITPPILGGLAATGHWTGGALAAVNLVISIIIYLPFVKLADRIDAKKEAVLIEK